tara:strand:- start:75 stop:686 length:612 start_codon:yes stop_codon:yes gene_type:complete
MFLLNPRTNIYKYKENNVNMNLKMVPVNRRNRYIPTNRPIEEIKVVEKKPRVKEMLWGEPTWFLFHTLAEKIKEEEFLNLRGELLGYIQKICGNLPCPTCAEHASRHLNGINFNTIQTKEDLQFMLFSFHNDINKKKDYEIFSFNDLHEKYSSAVTLNIVKNFFHHFSKKQYNVRMAVDNFHRHKLLKEFRVWLESKYYCFYS